MTSKKIESLPTWRLDNLWLIYCFFVAVICATFSFSKMYFDVTSELRAQRQDILYIKDSVQEMKEIMKERQAFNNETRDRVVVLETQVSELSRIVR